MNGTVPRAIFTDLDQPSAYSVLTEILGFGPSWSDHLLHLGLRQGGITDNGVKVTARYTRDAPSWTITKES